MIERLEFDLDGTYRGQDLAGQKFWVEFADVDDLTGRDVRELRKAFNKEGGGDIINELMSLALRLLIRAWEVPYLPTLDIPSRQVQEKNGRVVWDSSEELRARDLTRIEKHLQPHLDFLRSGIPDDGAPGGPRQPASE